MKPSGSLASGQHMFYSSYRYPGCSRHLTQMRWRHRPREYSRYLPAGCLLHPDDGVSRYTFPLGKLFWLYFFHFPAPVPKAPSFFHAASLNGRSFCQPSAGFFFVVYLAVTICLVPEVLTSEQLSQFFRTNVPMKR